MFGEKNLAKFTMYIGIAVIRRWASVNDPVKNKFRSIIHLLSQSLLA